MTISRDPYKGTRDFFPEDMEILQYLFRNMREVASRFGYLEYGASPLEPAELYIEKTGEEIVNNQTYTFTDRGGRLITLRPEMTPTLARMIAARKRELSMPLRWFSIPNVFRYEQPQRGRLREHYQLNVDLFGVSSVEAEIEVINIGYELLKRFGAKPSDFEIRIGNRKIFEMIVEFLHLEKVSGNLAKLIDKQEKMSRGEFEKLAHALCADKTAMLLSLLRAKDLEEFVSLLPPEYSKKRGIEEIEEVLIGLSAIDIRNAVFRPDLMRGFDYYTGIIFEFFDTNKENNRSLFGGGRYDELLAIFEEEPIPAVGFGMGDVTAQNFLQTHNLLPKFPSAVEIWVCTLKDSAPDFVNDITNRWRKRGLNVAIDWTRRKIGDQIKAAEKQKIRFIACLGPDEQKTHKVSLRDIIRGTEYNVDIDKVPSFIKKMSIS